MIEMTWWAVPGVLEAVLSVCCSYIATIPLPFAPVAAASLFLIGSLVMAVVLYLFLVLAE